MRFRLLALSAIATAASLVACSSGGSSIPSTGGGGSSGGGAASGGTPSSTASQAIIANDPAATTIATSGGLTVTIPAKTFATAANVTVYQYASASGLPAAAQSHSRKTAQGRVRALSAMPAGSTFLAGFAISSGTAQAFQPIGVTETFSASVPAGEVLRVAKFGANGYTDVDTATATGSSASNDKNIQYVSVSTAGGTTQPYIFYATANPAAPAAISVGIQQQQSSQSLTPGGSINYTTQGSDANGNYLPFTATFTTSSSALATATSTQQDVGTITAGATLGAVTITSTDPRTSATGSISSSILASRPGASGDTFSFAGTLTRTDSYTYPNPPLPPTTVTAGIKQSVVVSVTPNPFESGNASMFTTSESDSYPTQTLATTTQAYYTNLPLATVPAPFQLFGTLSSDDAGNQSGQIYINASSTPNPQTVDELPEINGATWTNNPAGVYFYLGTNGEEIEQQTAADGSYQAFQQQGVGPTPGPSNPTPSPDPNTVTIEYSSNSDGSGAYTVYNFAAAGYLSSASYSAPSGGNITAQINVYPEGASPTPAPLTETILAWYPVGAPLYSEADVDDGPSTVPCNVPAAFAGASNKLNQQITQIDTVLGTITTTNTTQYVVAGFGPVCETIADETKVFYDYDLDSTAFPVLLSASGQPLQDTRITETLAITASSGSDVSASSRKSLVVGHASLSLLPLSAGALANARTQIELINRRDRTAREKSLRAFTRRRGTFAQFKGVQK